MRLLALAVRPKMLLPALAFVSLFGVLCAPATSHAQDATDDKSVEQTPRTPLSGRAFSLYDPTDAGLSPLPWNPAAGPADQNAPSFDPSAPASGNLRAPSPSQSISPDNHSSAQNDGSGSRPVPLAQPTPQLTADALNDQPASADGRLACKITLEALSGLGMPWADCFATATALHIRAPSPQGVREERLLAEAKYQFLSIIAGGLAMAHFDAPPIKWVIVGHNNAAACLATPADSAKDDIRLATKLAEQAKQANTANFDGPEFDELEAQMVRNLRKAPCLAGPGASSAQ